MKKTGLALLGLLLILAFFVLHLFSSTGFFRKIENKFDGQIVKSIAIPGAEDMVVSYEDRFILISSDDRAANRDGHAQQGGIYKIDLQQDLFEAKLISGSFKGDLFPHGISMIRLDSAVYKVFVINHVVKSGAKNALSHLGKKHTVEVFRLEDDSLTYLNTIEHPLIVSPNDLVAVDENRFYITNDHGSKSSLGVFMENYLGRAISNVVYFDGLNTRKVAGDIAYANGINYDRKKKLLFVASPRKFLIKVYQVKENGNLTFIENIDCKTGVDNIELDTEGKLWVGCHPNLLRFTAYASGKKQTAPSELITVDYRSVGNYEVQSIYTNDGSAMSASSVAVVYGDYIYAGNVMDDHFLILKR